MDSAEIVTQQPVSTLPDLVSDAPLAREGLLAATVEATSLNPTEPVAMLSKPETLPMSESPSNGQIQEVTNKTDLNGNVEKVVDSSISTGRLPPNTAIVQQIKDGTVDIEVELAAAAATDAESRFVVSSMQLEAGGHVGGLLIPQADGKSKTEEIAVEVVLNDVMPHVSDAQPSSSGDGGGGDLGEVLASVELVVETAGVMAGKGSSNVAENRSTQHSGLVANAGSSIVEIEAVVVSDADNTLSSTAIAVVVEQGGAGTEEAGRNEHEITSIAGLEQVGVEVVMSDPAVEENVSLMEKDSSCILRFEEETPIEEPQLMNNSEGEKKPLVDNVIQLGTGDTSAAAIVTTEEVILVAVSEGALNASDLSTVNVNNLNVAPELESSAAVMTLDQHADIAKEQLNVSDSSVTRIVGGPGTAAELDSNSLVTADGGGMIMGELGSIAGSTSITKNEIKEESKDIRVVDHTEKEVLSTEKNAGPTEVSEIRDIPTVSCKAEMEELSNSEEVKIIETSFVHLVETTEMLGPTEETNVEVRLSTDEVIEVETSLEILIQTQQDKIEDPQESSLKTEMAEEETLIQTMAEKFQEDTGVKSSEERAEQQEMNTKVTKDARIPLDETMNNVNNVNNSVDITAVEKGEDTEMVDAPAAKQEGEAVPITKSMELEESGAPIDEDLIDPEASVVAVEETIDTTISIIKIQHDKIEGDLIEPEGLVLAVEETVDTTISTTTIQRDNGGAEAEDVDGHGVLIGVGSSVESSGLTITEIADNSVQVEEFQVEEQSGWVLSDEPLITPPEEEIIDSIEDLCGVVNDIVDEDEPPQRTETLLLVVTEDDARNNESNDFLPTPFDRETEIPSETTASALNSQHAAQSELQTTSATVVVDRAEPLDLQDEQSLVPTLTETEMESVHIARIISLPLTTPPETMQPTDIVAEDIALQEGSVQGYQDGIPAIIAEIVDLPTGEEGVSLPIEVLSSDPHSVEKKVADVGTSLTPAFEFHPVSISMSSCCVGNLSSIEESATAIVEPVARVDQDNTTEGDASDVRALTTSELGFGLEAAAVDKSVLSEARATESAEASEVAPAVVADMDGRNDEQVVECALDGSAYIVVDELETVEALERNEKKRARQEEGNAVVEDSEKTSKAAKTSNGEVSLSCDVGAKIGEDVQVDKKRSRDEMEIVAANPDVSIQTKVQKTETVDDIDVLQSHKADSDEEAEVEECVDMEDKEEVQEKSANGAGQDSTAPRYKKRKIALFLGYCGAGYQGMQKNPGAITIEGELEEALFRAGAIAESNYGQPKKLDWRRAARTDKGVSAVGQVVSGCFFIDPPGFIDRVNSHLPKQIRVYGYKRATAGFNAKKLCDRRKYEYVLPVYAFDPTVHLDRETAQALAAAQNDNSMDQIEMSASTIETEASVVIESEMKETTKVEEIIESEMKETTKVEESTETLVEPVGETETDVSSITDASNSAIPKIEGKQDNKSSSNGMSTVTEEVIMVTEIAEENVATGVKVRTEETLVEMKEVTMADTEVQRSPKEKEALNEKASTAQVEVLVQTKEVSTERTEVTVAETVIDLSAEEKKEALDEKVKNSEYKFDEAEFIRLNRILKGFEGHHNFHNFTARTKATDPSANRYIISFEVENTFTIDGVEFVRCSVVGQSFMLHQIRKMIGLAVAIMRGTAPESILVTALRKDTKINVPMAPELGLFLEECYYSAYNRRFKVTHEEMSLSSFSAEVNEFKKEFIYPHIGSTEARDSTFAMWLHSLNDRHYPDFVAAREAEKLVKSQ